MTFFRPEGGNKISLIDHRIQDLEEDKNGFLWIATSAELFSCYDLKKDCFSLLILPVVGI